MEESVRGGSRAIEGLAAQEAYGPLREKLMLYGRFVGSWSVESAWYPQGREGRKGRGEWHFSWILGGRGVQDVLYSLGAAPAGRGTTIRCYDETADLWRLTWMQPAEGEFVHLVGRAEGERIVQVEEGDGRGGRLARWSFADIAASSFLWIGESSTDGGRTWSLEQEMKARRVG
jgi:hypothetical protein